MKIDPILVAEIRKIKEGGHTVTLDPKPGNSAILVLVDGKLCGVLTQTAKYRHILNVRAQMRRAVQS